MEKATVQSIDRALSIIETLAGEKEGLGVTEISTRVGLHKSTVHRLLSALGERGYPFPVRIRQGLVGVFDTRVHPLQTGRVGDFLIYGHDDVGYVRRSDCRFG